MSLAPVDEDSGRIEALNEALDRYRSGRADLGTAAEEAGMADFEFLEVAKTLPGTIPADKASDLPTFVRRKP